jgi:hypothetical protein
VIDITKESEDVVISDVLSFDELVEIIAQDKNISIDQAKNEIMASQRKKLSKGNRVLTSSELENMIMAKTYRTIERTIDYWFYWKPKVRFYVETSEWGSYWGILQIVDSTLIREYLYVSKQFSGTLFVNLESAYMIYYYVNGDFYDNGTTTQTAGFSIGVGEYLTIEYSVSYSSNHFGYMFYEERINTQPR